MNGATVPGEGIERVEFGSCRPKTEPPDMLKKMDTNNLDSGVPQDSSASWLILGLAIIEVRKVVEGMDSKSLRSGTSPYLAMQQTC